IHKDIENILKTEMGSPTVYASKMTHIKELNQNIAQLNLRLQRWEKVLYKDPNEIDVSTLITAETKSKLKARIEKLKQESNQCEDELLKIIQASLHKHLLSLKPTYPYFDSKES